MNCLISTALSEGSRTAASHGKAAAACSCAMVLRRSLGLCSPSISSQPAPAPAMISVLSALPSEHHSPRLGRPAASEAFNGFGRSCMILELSVRWGCHLYDDIYHTLQPRSGEGDGE